VISARATPPEDLRLRKGSCVAHQKEGLNSNLNIFGWIVLVMTVSVLAGIGFVLAVIAIEMRRGPAAARGSLKPLPYPYVSRAIGAGLLGAGILILFLTKLSPRLGLGEVDYPYLVGSALPAGFGLAGGVRRLAGCLTCLLVGMGWALVYAFYIHGRMPGPGWLQGMVSAGVGGSDEHVHTSAEVPLWPFRFGLEHAWLLATPPSHTLKILLRGDYRTEIDDGGRGHLPSITAG
jgi:hypothetical protein